MLKSMASSRYRVVRVAAGILRPPHLSNHSGGDVLEVKILRLSRVAMVLTSSWLPRP